MHIVVLQALIATGLLGVSLWRYRHSLGGEAEEAEEAGRGLWVVWVGFGIVSLVILAASGPDAVLLGGVVTWVFCVAGTALGSRLLMRAFPARADDIMALTFLFAFGVPVLGFFFMLLFVGSAWSQVRL